MSKRPGAGPIVKSQPSTSCINTEDDDIIHDSALSGGNNNNNTDELGILVAVRIRPFTRQEKEWDLKKQRVKGSGEKQLSEPIVDVGSDGKTITLLDPVNRSVSKTKFNFEYIISSLAPSVEVDIFDNTSNEPLSPSIPTKQEPEQEQEQEQQEQEQQKPQRQKKLLAENPTSLVGENSEEEAEREQENIFQALGVPLVYWSLRGFNACIFAYGQTGSGKTYTMMGSQSHEGLIPRVTRHLFNSIAEQAVEQDRLSEGEVFSFPGSPPTLNTCSKGDVNGNFTLGPNLSPPRIGGPPTARLTKVTISFMEIHNERVCDLLKLERRKGNGNGAVNYNYASRFDSDISDCYEALKVRQHPIQGPFVEGLTTVDVSSWEECQQYINQGNAVRTQASTGANENSSRSHAIFQMVVTQTISLGGRVRGKEVTTQRVSKINLVDLAGSERNTHADVKGKHFTEANAINLSLSVLRRVICALVNRSRVVPYRESLLTYVLSDNFGGNSRTAMCANVSPHTSKYAETESTLRYAALARGVVNQVRVNEHPLAKVIRELRGRLRQLQQDLRRSVEEEVKEEDKKDEKEGKKEEERKEMEIGRLEACIARHAESLAEARRRERNLRADLRRRQREGRRWQREAQRQREAKVRLLAALRDVARDNPQLHLPGDVPIAASDTEDEEEENEEEEEEMEEEQEQEQENCDNDERLNGNVDHHRRVAGRLSSEDRDKDKENVSKSVNTPPTILKRQPTFQQLPRISPTQGYESPPNSNIFTQRPQNKGQQKQQQRPHPPKVARSSEGNHFSPVSPQNGRRRSSSSGGGRKIKNGNSGNDGESLSTECPVPHPPLSRRAGSCTPRSLSGMMRSSQCAIPLSLQRSDNSVNDISRPPSGSPEFMLVQGGVNQHIMTGIPSAGPSSQRRLQTCTPLFTPPKRKKKKNNNNNNNNNNIVVSEADNYGGNNNYNNDKENGKRTVMNRPPPLHAPHLLETPFPKPESILTKRTPNSNPSNSSSPQITEKWEGRVSSGNLALLKRRDAVVAQRPTPRDTTRSIVRKG